MRPYLRPLLQFILKYLARLTLWRYRPAVVGVTGNTGKTSTKIAIGTVLASERRVRFTSNNFNTEFGIPLVILSEKTDLSERWFWIKIVLRGIWNLLRPVPYPEIIVLEYGIDHPGEMRTLLDIARPNIGVITAIGEIPTHVEFFSGPEEVAREKARLIEQLPAGGFAVLNQDSHVVMDLKDRTRAHRITFGFGREATVRVSNFTTRLEGNRPVGVSFKLEYAGSFVPVRLDAVFGRAQAYSTAAAAAVGLIFGMNLVKISEALKTYHSPSQRFQLFSGIRGSTVIDDSYNASPLSMEAALDTVRDLPGKRKIGVLGDMKELGSFSERAHYELGQAVAETLSILVTVGPAARSIADGAIEAGMSKKNVFSFQTAEEAVRPVQDLVKKDDLVLVKASHSVNLETVVQKIRASENALIV